MDVLGGDADRDEGLIVVALELRSRLVVPSVGACLLLMPRKSRMLDVLVDVQHLQILLARMLNDSLVELLSRIAFVRQPVGSSQRFD